MSGASRFLFVGERPSLTAARKGYAWKDGRLAAKQLFDALRASGIEPETQRFDNVFVPNTDGPEEVCPQAVARIIAASAAGWTVVAMGRKVARALADKVAFVEIVHPAARGRIRRKELYCQHVQLVLRGEPASGKS